MGCAHLDRWPWLWNKASRANYEKQARKQCFSTVFASVLVSSFLLEFLPWLPWMMECYLLDRINPLFAKLLLLMALSQPQKSKPEHKWKAKQNHIYLRLLRSYPCNSPVLQMPISNCYGFASEVYK